MDKLPVLFVSCHVDNLQLQEHTRSGPARMVRGQRYDSVVLISTASGLHTPEIRCIKGGGGVADKIRALLNLGAAPDGGPPEWLANREKLLQVMLLDAPDEVSELTLNTGMGELEYRRLGACLKGLREQGVLIICLDDVERRADDRAVALHDRRLREMIEGWVLDQQWTSALLFKGEAPRSGSLATLDDPTVCLLNAAFSLGDSTFPQRMFSSSMNNDEQRLSGFGWMR